MSSHDDRDRGAALFGQCYKERLAPCRCAWVLSVRGATWSVRRPHGDGGLFACGQCITEADADRIGRHALALAMEASR